MKTAHVLGVLALASLGCAFAAACSSSSTTTPAANAGTDSGTDAGTAPGLDGSMTADSSTGSDSGATTTIAAARTGNVTTPITVQAVVTALHGAPGDYSQWYIEDPAGGPSSGVVVYCDKDKSCALPEPALHDLILITGSISNYKGALQLVPTAKSTVQAGAALPPIPTLTMTDLAEGANSPYRGVLVKYDATKLTVDNATPAALYDTTCGSASSDAGVDGGPPLCAGCSPPTYSGFQANDGQGHEVYIEAFFFNTDHLQSSPECTSAQGAVPVSAGMTFTSIQGVLDYDSYAMAQQISPVSDSDYVTP
jgi:hypothetical protein